MEYSDGSDGVAPGEDIHAGSDDLGAATYDSNHDGVADSVILGQGEYTLVVTDDNGDGSADHVTAYDAEGHEVNPKVAGLDPSADPAGSDLTGADTGASDHTGATSSGSDSFGTDSSGPVSSSSGADSSGPASSGTDTGDPNSTDGSSGTAGAAGADTSDGTSADSGSDAAGSITIVDDNGHSVDVGPPTVDMDGDGHKDTAVVRNDDGSTSGYTDRNGDGEADQITQIGTDNQVTILVADGNGGWEVAETGHLDSNGDFAEGSGSGADSSGNASSSSTSSTSGGDHLVNPVEGVAEPAADQSGISYTDATGQTYTLGAPTADFNGDGTPDTVVTTLDNGTVVGYSDVDGDGQTDQVTQIDPDGTVTIGVPDGNGGWEQAATGTLGANGEFVPAPVASTV
ncbi:MAG: hypothetical protein M3Y77_03065 [Actinomycetota bacterium]|nr:hypothetical protein [Actinomycetota bacterium]